MFCLHVRMRFQVRPQIEHQTGEQRYDESIFFVALVNNVESLGQILRIRKRAELKKQNIQNVNHRSSNILLFNKIQMFTSASMFNACKLYVRLLLASFKSPLLFH